MSPISDYEIMRDPGGYITEDTATKILSATSNIRDELMVRILWETGIRTTEMLGLTFDDISAPERLIIVNSLKKRHHDNVVPRRSIRVTQATIDLVKQYKKSKRPVVKGIYGLDHGPTWHDAKRLFPMSRSRIFQLVREICTRAHATTVSNKPIHTHHFRHGFAMHYIANGGDIGKLRIMMGHSSLMVTQSYLKYSQSDISDEYDTIQRDGIKKEGK